MRAFCTYGQIIFPKVQCHMMSVTASFVSFKFTKNYIDTLILIFKLIAKPDILQSVNWFPLIQVIYLLYPFIFWELDIFFLLIHMSFHVKNIFTLIYLHKNVLICCISQPYYTYKWLQNISYTLAAGWWPLLWDIAGSVPRVLIILGSQLREQPHRGSSLFLWRRVKIKRTRGDIYWLLMLLFRTGIWHMCSFTVAQNRVGKCTPPTGVHVKSHGSGQEWIILSL